MNPTLGYGTTLTWNGQTVAKLQSINGIEISVASVDVTTHDSADGFTASIPGLATAGDCSVAGFFDPADATGQVAMMADAIARTSRTGVITFPSATGSTWTFTGFITAIKVGDAPTGEGIPFTATIHPTGKPTFATSASTGLTNPYFAISESAVIAPAAAGNVYTYVATVLSTVTSVTVTPTATAGTITVNGNTVATGEASSAITLGAAGSVTPITIVVTETGKSPKTYTIYLTRAA